MNSKFKCCVQVVSRPVCASTALLILRWVAGIAFIFHGWGKIQNPFGWMGPDAATPAIFQLLAAVSEFGGGIAWVLGLLTPLASFGIGCTMIVAVYFHAVLFGDPFVCASPDCTRSYELALVYLSIAITIFALGPGKFSLDAKIFGERS